MPNLEKYYDNQKTPHPWKFSKWVVKDSKIERLFVLTVTNINWLLKQKNYHSFFISILLHRCLSKFHIYNNNRCFLEINTTNKLDKLYKLAIYYTNIATEILLQHMKEGQKVSQKKRLLLFDQAWWRT